MNSAENRELKIFELEKAQDQKELDRDKQQYIKELKQNLGSEMMNYNNYIKKPNRYKEFRKNLKKLWRSFLNVINKI